MLTIAACSDTSAPAITKAAPAIANTIFCNPDGSCYSDGNEATGPHLSVQIRSGCIPNNLKKTPGSCNPVAHNISGGTSGSYSVRYFSADCGSTACGTNYEIPSPPRIDFASDTYEIDVTAEVQEIGGTQLTGVATVQVMGPGSIPDGSGSPAPCPSTSGSIFAPYPFEEPAYDPASGQQATDPQGNLLYQNYALSPCAGGVVLDSAPPHKHP
jgi:hypothetical protein